jgi:hypothetical protein
MSYDDERRRHELRCYTSDRERHLIEAGAEVEGVSVSEYLRTCGAWVAREHLGLEVYDERELVQGIVERLIPAES